MKKNGFVKELYIQKEPDIDNRTFEAQLQKTVETASNNLSVLICQKQKEWNLSD